jgi:flagellin-like hook-associated protein FlgL
LNSGRDFGITGTDAQVEIAFDSSDNLYVTADRSQFIPGFGVFIRPTMRSFDANGGDRWSQSVKGFGNTIGGLIGSQAHSPVADGANAYIAIDPIGGGSSEIRARQTSNGNSTAGFTTINLPGTERAIKNPVINGANLYVSTSAGKVHSYNKTNGTFVATFDSGNPTALTMPVFDGTDFYVGQANTPGSLHKVDSTTMTRTASWTTSPSAAGPIGTPPLVVGNEVYVGTTGSVQGFEAPVPSTTILDQNVAPPNNYAVSHSVGDNIAVTVETTGGTLTQWEGTAEVKADGSLDLKNFAVNTGSAGTISDLTGNLNVTVVSPAVTPTLPPSLKIGSDYVTGDAPKVTVNIPGPDNTLGTVDDPTPAVLLSTGAPPKVKVITQAMITASDTGFDGVAYVAGDLGKLDVDLSGVTTNGTGNYTLVADAGAIHLDLTHGNTNLTNHGTGYAAGETVAFIPGSSTGITYTGTATATVDAGNQIDVDVTGITPTSTGPLTLAFDGPLQRPPNLTSALVTAVGNNGLYDASEAAPLVTIKDSGGTVISDGVGIGMGANDFKATTSIITAAGADQGKMEVTFTGNPLYKDTYTVEIADGTYFKLPATLLNQGSGYNTGDSPSVTITQTILGTKTTATGVTGTAIADGNKLGLPSPTDSEVDLTFTTTGSLADGSAVTVAIGEGGFSWPGATTLRTDGANYDATEDGITLAKPTITITPPGGGTAYNVTPAAVSVVAGGQLQFTLPPPTESGNHTISASGGTYYKLPTNILDQGTVGAYTPGYKPPDTDITITRTLGGAIVPPTSYDPGIGPADIAIADANGQIDLTFADNANLGTGNVDIAIGPGSMSWPGGTIRTEGNNYTAPQTVTITPPGGGTPTTVTPTVVGGQLQFTLPTPTVAGLHTITAPDGPEALANVTVGSGYAQTENPLFQVQDNTGTTVKASNATINANGTANIDLTGVANGNGPYTITVDPGTVSGQQQGLDDTSKDLWDFSHADFENFIHTLTDVRAVNGATTSSLAFSESRLETNIQNLELAGGRIVDADMAEEMVEVAKSQILLQTATDSLSKHNKLSVRVDKTLMGLSGGM